MDIPDENREVWINDELIPYLISNGSLDIEREKIINVQVDIPDYTNNFMASNVYFVKLFYKSTTQEKLELHLVIKLIPELQLEFVYLEDQFRNEITIYTQILPEIGAQHLFPRFYYGIINGPNSIIVLEDIGFSGYRMAESKLILSLDHLELAVKQLGRYHGYCYKHKEKYPDKLKELSSKLVDIRGSQNNQMSFFKEQKNFISLCVHRGINYLKSVGDFDEKLMKTIEDMLENIDEFMCKIMEPSEPLSLLTHGDFCRNNMMFKYDESGKPIDIQLFDLQLCRYTSPAIDLSFLLYMNSDYDTRENKFLHILSVYHEAMIDVLGDDRLGKYSFEKFRENYEEKHVYGFIIAIFFTLVMYDPAKSIDITNDRKIGLISMAEADSMMSSFGGEAGDKHSGELVKSLCNIISNRK